MAKVRILGKLKSIRVVIVFGFASFFFSPAIFAQTPPTPQSSVAEEQDYAFAYGLYKDGLFQLAVDQFDQFLQKNPSSLKYPDAHFLKMECLFQQGQFESAAKGFAEFVNRFPTSNLADNAYFRLGDTYGKMQRNQEAIRSYKSVLDFYGESDLAGEAAYWIGETYVKSQEYDQAIKYYTLAFENYPNNRLRDYALYSVAWTYQRKGEYAKGADAYRTVIREFPQSPLTAQSKVRIGECYYYLKEYRRAIEELTASRATIQAPEQRGEADYLIAESHYHLNELDKARAQYQEFLTAYPGHALTREVIYALGWTLLKQKEFTAAAETFHRLVEGSDALAHSALYRRGVAEKLGGNRQSALQTFVLVFTNQPQGDFADNALFDAGLIHFEEKRFADARPLFSRVIAEYKPSDVLPDAYQMAGECLLAEGNIEAAKGMFENAASHPLASFDVKVVSRYQIGWCLFKTGKLKEAVSAFSRFLETYPEHPRAAEALYWLAEAEYQGENYRASLRQYQLIADKQGQPRREEGMYGVGWSHFKLKDYTKAIVAFERLIAAYPNGKFSFDGRLRLGDSYFFQKDYKRAGGVYRTVVRLFPRHEGADYASYQLAQTHFRANEFDQAAQQFSLLIASYPGSSLADDAQYALGWIPFQRKQYQQAIQEFQQVLRNYSESELAAKAQYSIGDAYYNMQQYDPAERAYREVVTRYPRSAHVLDAMTGIQYCLVAQGKQGEALAAIDAFVRDQPNSPVAEQLSLRKGDLLYGQKQYDGAVGQYRAFVDRYPRSTQRATALYWMGKSLAALNRLPEAAAAYEQAATSSGGTQKITAGALIDAVHLHAQLRNYEQAYNLIAKGEKDLAATEWASEIAYLKGLLFFENEAIPEAKNQYELVTAKFASTPQADKARVGLVRIHLRNGELVAGQALAQKVATSRTDEIGAEAQYLNGVIFMENKDWRNAETAFLRMRYVFPSHEVWLAKAYLSLGVTYEAMNNPPKARDAYQNVLKLQKEGETVTEASRRLKNLERL